MIKIKRIMALIGIIIGIILLFYYFPKELAWINQQYGLLITISISILIPWLTSERWVEQYRLKRDHSMELAEESLSQWKEEIDELTKIESKIYIESFEFEYILPKPKSSIIYFKYLNEHLQKGHPIILELWSKIENYHTSVNLMKTDIKENIRKAIINDDSLKKLELTPHYQIQIFERKLNPPPEHYVPDTITDLLLLDIDYFQKYQKHWSHFERRKYTIKINEQDKHAIELMYMDKTIFRTLNEDNIDILKKWFIDFSERHEIINMVRSFNDQDALLEIYKMEFVNALDELIWFVRLGNNLKGECSFCPAGIFSAIKNHFLD